jgi:hypothetical protein
MKKDDVINIEKTSKTNSSYSELRPALGSKAKKYNEVVVVAPLVENGLVVNESGKHKQRIIRRSPSFGKNNLTKIETQNQKKNTSSVISSTYKNVEKSIILSTKIPQKLKHIELSINNAQSILNLSDNWDDDGAFKVPKNVHNSAILFLKKYALFLLNDLKTVISAPDINPVKDGSIDLEWHTPNARMLINVNNSGKIGYYGDNFDDLNSIKGKVADDSVQTFLAVWMTKLTI